MRNKFRLAMISAAFITGSSIMAFAQSGGTGGGTTGTPGMSWRYNGYRASGAGSTATAGYGSSTGAGYGSSTGAGYGSSTGAGYGSSTGPVTGEPGIPNNISGEGLGGGAGGADLGGGSGGPARAGAGMSGQ